MFEFKGSLREENKQEICKCDICKSQIYAKAIPESYKNKNEIKFFHLLLMKTVRGKTTVENFDCCSEKCVAEVIDKYSKIVDNQKKDAKTIYKLSILDKKVKAM